MSQESFQTKVMVGCFDILILENIWILQGLACLKRIYDQINLLNMFLVWVCSNALKRFIWNQNQITWYIKSDFKIRQFNHFFSNLNIFESTQLWSVLRLRLFYQFSGMNGEILFTIFMLDIKVVWLRGCVHNWLLFYNLLACLIL